ncbi:MAG TPA: DUF4864 domain-containing protein [Burkholderiales bacterium]|jgi:hypothetical protein|nr:DUF4864 domain-containing protein [Burkholderiales bacterium]
MLRFALALLALAIPLSAGAAERVTGDDAAEIRAVIHRQIDAFRRDDARSAFALVSPGVQQEFGTPERFLDTVRTSYRAVYRPASVSFLELVVMGGDVVQQVQVTDNAGSVWVAYYAMQKQKDGSWRTNGCHLVQPTRTISA